MIALTVKLIPKDTFEVYRKQAEGMWREGKPKKWYYAIPILMLWMLVLWLIIRAIFF